MSDQSQATSRRSRNIRAALIAATIPVFIGLYESATSLDLHSLRVASGILIFLASVIVIVMTARCWIHVRYTSGMVLGGAAFGITGLVYVGYLLTVAVDDVREAAERSN